MLGATAVNANPELPLTVVWALQHTPETKDPADHQRLLAFGEVRHALTPKLPRAIVLGVESAVPC